ncbi:T9SS type A sorting domain-containing protein [Solitalea sp. MAHUQ-68]|uniref:T9SS type A sorting domain-containing protein n=1 Tax=Solitalea agri TaxID=2953739 RepID=A0A9X2F3I4_9SPHI|nr:T9SS type A sorting domain-containing protein [Solitalea agri]MCO4294012.1 T9SS type A sorting domain-containing protein [Solitalea agri]
MKYIYNKHTILLLLALSASIAAIAGGVEGLRLGNEGNGTLSDSLSSFSKSVISEKKGNYVLKNTVSTSFTVSRLLYNAKTILNPATAYPSRSIMFANAQEEGKNIIDVKVYPNPVNDEFTVSYNLRKDNTVTIKLMDLLGNEISTLVSQQQTAAGVQEIKFNVRNSLQKGFYFVRVTVGNESVSKRISIL